MKYTKAAMLNCEMRLIQIKLTSVTRLKCSFGVYPSKLCLFIKLCKHNDWMHFLSQMFQTNVSNVSAAAERKMNVKNVCYICLSGF